MKVNSKTVLFPIVTTVIYGILVLASIILRLTNTIQPQPFLFAIEITYVLPIIYMAMVLKHFDEKKFTVGIYTFYIFFDIALVLYYLLTKPSPTKYLISVILGALSVTIINILIIQAFNFKNRQLIVPFCVYGFVFLLISFFKLVGLLFMISHWKSGITIFNCTIPSEILLPVAMLYLFFGIKKYLKSTEAAQASALLQTDPEKI